MVNENLNLERIKEDEKLIPEKTPKEGGKFEEQKIDFEAEENKNLFQELGDDTKNFVDKLYEGAKMNLIDKPKIMFNSVLLNWHEKKSINLSSKISSNIEEVASWEKLINMHGDRLKSFQEKFGEIPSDVQAKS